MNHVKWLNEDLEWLKKNSANYTAKELAEKLGRSKEVIIQYCSKFNISYKKENKKVSTIWTKERIEWLKENSIKYTAEEMALHFGCSIQNIQTQCSRLKIKYIAKNLEAFWTLAEKEWLIQNSSKYTIKEIVKHFNGKYSKDAISWQRQYFKINFKLDDCFWNEEETNWLVKNSENFTREELAIKLNTTVPNISKICRKLKINFKPSNYFDFSEDLLENVDTPEKAYFLGWFHTDGYLNVKTKAIIFNLADIEPLEIFNRIFNLNVPIRKCSSNKKFPNRKQMYCWSKTLRNTSETLQKLGYDNRKTYTAKFPEIPEHLYYHFLRGFIDGDGSIFITKDNYIRVNFLGTFEVLNKIKDFIGTTNKICIKKNSKECFSLSLSGKKAKKFLEKIYINSENLRLTRKFEIWQKYLEYKNL